jgi:hypothetical protein
MNSEFVSIMAKLLRWRTDYWFLGVRDGGGRDR